MTIQILRRGTPPAEARYRTECYRCYTAMTYGIEDVCHEGRYNEVHLKCPVCGTFLDHDRKNVVP